MATAAGMFADKFFLKQKNERILAQKANGMSNSLNWPDRGDKGSQATFSVPGNYETPGPQNVHMANEMMPGMGQVMSHDMMPGMGQVNDMMPGMGGISDLLTTRNLLIGGGILAAVFMLKGR